MAAAPNLASAIDSGRPSGRLRRLRATRPSVPGARPTLQACDLAESVVVDRGDRGVAWWSDDPAPSMRKPTTARRISIQGEATVATSGYCVHRHKAEGDAVGA